MAIDYIYGSLDDSVVPVEYNGSETSTAITSVDNNKRIISVDVKNSSSGGTQLYKHMARLNVIGEDYDPIDIHLMLISWLNVSFEGLHWKELNGKYINAFAIEDRDGEEWITQVISIVNDNDEVQIFIKDQQGNEISYKPNWDGEYTCYVIEDTITEL